MIYNTPIAEMRWEAYTCTTDFAITVCHTHTVMTAGMKLLFATHHKSNVHHTDRSVTADIRSADTPIIDIVVTARRLYD